MEKKDRRIVLYTICLVVFREWYISRADRADTHRLSDREALQPTCLEGDQLAGR